MNDLGRRDLLRGTLLTAATLVAPRVMAQTTLSPDDALKALLDGNQRFVSGQLDSFAEDFTILKQQNAEKQEPFAAVLACADSRVPVELLFDQSIGHVFVVRVAGNVTSPEVIASLEYGVAVLGVKAVVVLGHTDCGAIKAALAGKDVPGQISALFPAMRPAIDAAGPDLNAVIDANAKHHRMVLGRASPVVAEALTEGKLRVVAARYDIATGRVAVLA